MRAVGRVALVAASVAGAACGGGSDNGIPLGSWIVERNRVNCDYAVACGFAPDLATCHPALAVPSEYDATLMRAVERGHVTYHPEHARQCLDGYTSDCLFSPLRTLSRSDIDYYVFRRGPEACDNVFEGNLSAGATCFLDEECSGDGGCVKSGAFDCMDTCCSGTCVSGHVGVALGGSCAGNHYSVCESGAFCQDGACVAQLPVGAPCDQIASCQSPAICDISSKGICSVPPAEGETCDSPAIRPCRRWDNYCDSTTQVCTRKTPVGASCENLESCGAPHASCVGNVCVGMPTLGQACDVTFVESCFQSLQCISGICLPPSALACAD